MRNKNKIIVAQLDQKLAPFVVSAKIPVPVRGWVHAIRTGLNMTMEQLGNKLSKTKQSIKKIEDSEAKGTVTINTLKEVANALDMQLVYGFAPKNGSVKQLVHQKAERLATKIVLRTHKNMQLENQAITDEKINQSIADLTEELKRELKKSLWD